MANVIDLGRSLKATHPGVYDDLTDLDLGQRAKAKNPHAFGMYADVGTAAPASQTAVNSPASMVTPQPEPSFPWESLYPGAAAAAGEFGGGALGTMIAPGPGTAIGGILGSILGGMGGRALEKGVEGQPISLGDVTRTGAEQGGWTLGGMAQGKLLNAVARGAMRFGLRPSAGLWHQDPNIAETVMQNRGAAGSIMGMGGSDAMNTARQGVTNQVVSKLSSTTVKWSDLARDAIGQERKMLGRPLKPSEAKDVIRRVRVEFKSMLDSAIQDAAQKNPAVAQAHGFNATVAAPAPSTSARPGPPTAMQVDFVRKQAQAMGRGSMNRTAAGGAPGRQTFQQLIGKSAKNAINNIGDIGDLRAHEKDLINATRALKAAEARPLISPGLTMGVPVAAEAFGALRSPDDIRRLAISLLVANGIGSPQVSTRLPYLFRLLGSDPFTQLPRATASLLRGEPAPSDQTGR